MMRNIWNYLQPYFQRVIKDERFSAGIEPEDDSLWLPAQLLRTTSSILVQGSSASEEVLVNILRLFLSMACSQSCTLNGRLLIEILSKCGKIGIIYIWKKKMFMLLLFILLKQCRWVLGKWFKSCSCSIISSSQPMFANILCILKGWSWRCYEISSGWIN